MLEYYLKAKKGVVYGTNWNKSFNIENITDI